MKVIAINYRRLRRRRSRAGAVGDTATGNLAFPLADAALLVALVLVGVRPRLAEYH